AINNLGTVVGAFADTSGNVHGFVRTSDGTITTIDGPGSTGTDVFGLNDRATIVGSYVDSEGYEDCFFKKATGTFTSFTTPQSQECQARSINKAGVITGFYYDGSANTGFILDKGVVVTFGASGDAVVPVQINDEGVITGYVSEGGDSCVGFVRAADGTLTT